MELFNPNWNFSFEPFFIRAQTLDVVRKKYFNWVCVPAQHYYISPCIILRVACMRNCASVADSDGVYFDFVVEQFLFLEFLSILSSTWCSLVRTGWNLRSRALSSFLSSESSIATQIFSYTHLDVISHAKTSTVWCTLKNQIYYFF